MDDKFLNCAFESLVLTKNEDEPMKFTFVGYLFLSSKVINFTDQNKFIEGETTIDPTFTEISIQSIDFIKKPINLVKITVENNEPYIIRI